jgi:hypothetical protein
MEPAQLAALRPSGMRSRMLYAEVGPPREASSSACPLTRVSHVTSSVRHTKLSRRRAQWMMSIGSNASTSAEDGDQLPASAKAVGTTEDTKRQYLGRWLVKSAGLRSRSIAETLVQYQQEAERKKAEKLSNKQVLSDIAASQHVRKKHTMIYADSLRSVTIQKQLLGLCLQISGSGKTCTVRSCSQRSMKVQSWGSEHAPTNSPAAFLSMSRWVHVAANYCGERR